MDILKKIMPFPIKYLLTLFLEENRSYLLLMEKANQFWFSIRDA